MGNRVDTRRLAERIADPLVAFGVNAGGYKLGEMIAGPVGSAAAPSANAVARGRAALPSRIDDFRSVGVPNPPLGALSDSRAAGAHHLAELAADHAPALASLRSRWRGGS